MIVPACHGSIWFHRLLTQLRPYTWGFHQVCGAVAKIKSQTYHLTYEDLLSTTILKAEYCPKKPLWEAKFRKGNSWFWRGFVDAINFTNNYVGWAISGDSDISVLEYYN